MGVSEEIRMGSREKRKIRMGSREKDGIQIGEKEGNRGGKMMRVSKVIKMEL